MTLQSLASLMHRFPDWTSRLDIFLTSHQHCRFAYGQWDCCLFVCAAIEAMTGIDPAAQYRGNYRNRKQALRVIRQHTGRGRVLAVVEAVTRAHGMPEIAPGRARRGDIAMLRQESLGLVALNGRDVIVTSEQGLWRLPLTLIVRAWQV